MSTPSIRPRYPAKLTAKEANFLAIYRSILEAERDPVDRALSEAWIAGSKTGQTHRFAKAMRQLAPRMRSSEWLAYFANVGRKAVR